VLSHPDSISARGFLALARQLSAAHLVPA
jgi:hypothetical protein